MLKLKLILDIAYTWTLKYNPNELIYDTDTGSQA